MVTAKSPTFLSRLGWLFLGAFIGALLAITLPRLYDKYLEAPITIRAAGPPKLFIAEASSGQYVHSIQLPVEIEVKRGGKLSVKATYFETDIGDVESSHSRWWSGLGKGEVISETFFCKLSHPQRKPTVKGRFTLLTRRGEKASLEFTAHADD